MSNIKEKDRVTMQRVAGEGDSRQIIAKTISAEEYKNLGRNDKRIWTVTGGTPDAKELKPKQTPEEVLAEVRQMNYDSAISRGEGFENDMKAEDALVAYEAAYKLIPSEELEKKIGEIKSFIEDENAEGKGDAGEGPKEGEGANAPDVNN